jgi:parallel beta-helix repeat protein
MLFMNQITMWVAILAITIAPQLVLADPHHDAVAQCYDETDDDTIMTGKVKLEADMACPCADTVMSPFELVGDIYVNPALVLDGGELDLNGFTVSCIDTSDDDYEYVGIMVQGKHGKVKNGIVIASNQMYGIMLAGEGDHSVDDVTVIATDGNSVGVFVVTDKNKIKDTTALDAGNSFVIYPFAKKNTLDSCVATNSGAGFYIYGEENDVKHCTVVGSEIGLYISTISILGFEASHNSVTDSSFSSNEVGVVIEFGEGNMISKNEIFGNGEDGVILVGTNDFQILDNAIMANDGTGILVVDGCANGEVSGNTVFSNGDDGIMISEGSDDNTISGNHAMGNGDYDLLDEDEDCEDNAWDGNMGMDVNHVCVLYHEESSKKGGKKNKKVRGRRNE